MEKAFPITSDILRIIPLQTMRTGHEVAEGCALEKIHSQRWRTLVKQTVSAVIDSAPGHVGGGIGANAYTPVP